MNIEAPAALVTGAGSGIGRATAEQLARQGGIVGVNDIDEERARETVRLIEKAAGRPIPIGGDVASEVDVRRVIDAVRFRLGPLRVLINNAGIVEAGATPRIAFPSGPRRQPARRTLHDTTRDRHHAGIRGRRHRQHRVDGWDRHAPAPGTRLRGQ